MSIPILVVIGLIGLFLIASALLDDWMDDRAATYWTTTRR